MRVILFLLSLSSVQADASHHEPPNKKHRRNINLDTEYLARIMVDLLVQYDYIGCKTPELLSIMVEIPHKLWSGIDREKVKSVLRQDDLNFADIDWLRKTFANHIEGRCTLIEMAALIAKLENMGVRKYLFDGII